MKTRTLFLSVLALSSLCSAQQVRVHVVPVDSVEGFKAWLGTPVDPSRAANPTAYPGHVAQLPLGRKTQLPIVVTGLPSPAPQPAQLVADVEVLGTDGRSLGTSPRCCQARIARGSPGTAVLLESTVGVEPESGRPQGNYTVRVSVTDGSQTWTANEVLPYGGTTDMPGSHEAAPRLRMNVPPSQAEPGGPGDKRDCLALPTPADVIKCSEKK
ncbi:MAG TPA: hypothetical protein VFV90_06445 [Usitatibacter sp.]|nr:hypothetical protein [Usitatibacter sp.]